MKFARSRGFGVLSTAAGLAALLLTGSEAYGAGAITLATWDGAVTHETLTGVGDSASKTGAGASPSSMANNPALDGSAWAHVGGFWSVHVTSVPKLVIRVDADDPAQVAPGLSVWAIGHVAAFDGGTASFGAEVSNAGFGTPHSFNAFGPMGDSGTLWMQDGQGGNAKELLGYAIAGPTFVGTTGWGETITTGAHDISVSNLYEVNVSGSTGSGFAELVLDTPTTGWYLIYVGGTDHSLAGGLVDLTVSAEAQVPGLGLLGMAALIIVLAYLATRYLPTARA